MLCLLQRRPWQTPQFLPDNMFAVFLLLMTGLTAGNYAKGRDGDLIDVRLVGGDTNYEGRVEVFHNGTWGTVCDDYWDFRNSIVVCRQLGFPSALETNDTAAFGRGQGRIWMDDVQCTGHESSFKECRHRGWGRHNCHHSEDAGVSCTPARFIGGRSPREGLVQVYYNKTWSWVCAHQWDRKDADVACRMMGFDGSLSAAFENDNFKGPEIPLLLNNMRCTGNESSLFVRVHDGLGHHDCKIKRKAGVVCRAKVRLVGGDSVGSQGRVEVFHSGTWGTVCDDDWDLRDANVVCRQLGFPSPLATKNIAAFGRGQGRIWIDDVQCTGYEIQLTECPHRGWGRHNCGHSEDVGLSCTPAIRLVGGQFPEEAVVQVYYEDTWGWVCADQWDKQDADVACRMMDFDGSLSAGFKHERRTGIKAPVCFKSMECTGHESSLFECSHGDGGSDGCKGERIASVICKPRVRLVGGDIVRSQGRVEVFHFGTWGTVCDDDWDLRDANVVCRELGFPSALAINNTAAFGRGKGRIWMDDVQCTGHETSLTECRHRGWGRNDCDHGKDAGVLCTPDIRLVEGQFPEELLVQLYYNNTWGWVCADQWDKQDADVACRMMDFDGSLSAGFENKNPTGIKAPFWLNNLQCMGNETSLFSCVHSGLRSHDCREKRKAGVICRPRDTVVRLAGWGDVPSQGRVEVFYDGIWGPVCGHHWDLQDARVVCRQLGFKGALGAAMESASVNVSRWFINVTCVGSETSITKCDHCGWSYYCSWSESRYIAFVVCTTDSRNELSTEVTDTRASHPLLPAVIVLGILLSFAMIGVYLLRCKQRPYLQRESEYNDEEKHKITLEREADMATSSATARESEHTYFELRSMRAPQGQVNTERHYQELKHTSDSTAYGSANDEKRQGVYEEIKNASSDTYAEITPRTA